jgi:uncharacterized membrane protein YeaQ/YmgE (transglycosylase-associated protein family)
MRMWVIVIALVIIGIVGAWVGYWVGHALGWTTNAEFPFRIGAGDRAIGLSILVSFGSVMLGVWWFVARPLRRIGALLANGVPGHATVRRAWRTGMLVNRGGNDRRHELAFELDVHPDGGSDYQATALGLLNDAQEAGVRPGVEVDIRIDPAHPRSIAVVGPLGAAPA